ncbi:MAG: amidohydrolase family protein [Bacteroidetes bacterium]|jgi:cytosine/adenosine deaminase-related metal-dependent hydrolase|nr:amidohydrolase family protein [Bacteroidota bacterium]
MILNNVRKALTGQQVSIRVNNGKIAQVLPGNFYDQTDELNLSFDDAIVFPGLINSHDHLDFNLFPPLAGRTFKNYTEWGVYIHVKYKDTIDSILQIPEVLRMQWGIYKNLLCGVTTMVNHGKKIKVTNDLVTVFQECQSIHSVHFEKRWRFALNNPLKKNLPAVMHCGEGTDGLASNEIDRLIRSNLFSRPIVAVHGVAMNEEQAKQFKALVWCPESNYFLLDKTAPINHLKNHLPILFGTDSTLTGDWNIWNHIRKARQTGFLCDRELFESLTINPADVWGLNTGKIEEDQDADLVVSKAGSFFTTDPQNILLVLHKGYVSLFDETLFPQLKTINTSEYSAINIGGSNKYVKGNIQELITKIKQFYPNVSFPLV